MVVAAQPPCLEVLQNIAICHGMLTPHTRAETLPGFGLSWRGMARSLPGKVNSAASSTKATGWRWNGKAATRNDGRRAATDSGSNDPWGPPADAIWLSIGSLKPLSALGEEQRVRKCVACIWRVRELV